MKRIAALLVLSVVLVPAVAQTPAAPKPCEELKAQIAANLDAKGVKKYRLEIVAAGAASDKKVVGSCERGTKKIAYWKD